MELITRMRKVMHAKKEDFLIQYIPESLCWTEVPSNLTIFLRQRVRWARGLMQTLFIHRKIFLNPRYKKTGLIILPHYFLFEFLVPIIELVGVIVILLDICFFGLNLEFLLMVTAFVYLFYTSITLISIYADQQLHKQYSSLKEIAILLLMVYMEPILYHPINVFASLNGYFNFLINKEKKWGTMPRNGFNKAT